MKKKTNKSVNAAFSLNNGIVMHSNKNPLIAVCTYYEKKQLIKDQYLHGSQIKDIKTFEPITINKMLEIAISVTLFILAYVAYELTGNIGIILAVGFFIKQGLEYTISFFITVKRYKSKKGEYYERAKFHSAEHMVIAAYEKLGRIPTYEEVKKASRFSKECGSMQMINEMFYNISFPMLIVIWGQYMAKMYGTAEFLNINLRWKLVLLVYLYMIITGILYVTLISIVEKRAILRFMQIFFINKPTEKELKLAIEAIKNFEKLERIIDKNYMT